jgi:hypothetical protein
MQRSQDRQAGGARQSQARDLFPIGLELFQQLLVLRQFANLIENGFHNLYLLRFN